MARRGDGPPRRLGEILSTLLQKRAYARGMETAVMRDGWARAAGPRLARRTRVAQFRDGTLTIEVSSSAQRYELEAFQGGELLRKLQADDALPAVRRLVFRVGHFAP